MTRGSRSRPFSAGVMSRGIWVSWKPNITMDQTVSHALQLFYHVKRVLGTQITAIQSLFALIRHKISQAHFTLRVLNIPAAVFKLLWTSLASSSVTLQCKKQKLVKMPSWNIETQNPDRIYYTYKYCILQTEAMCSQSDRQ